MLLECQIPNKPWVKSRIIITTKNNPLNTEATWIKWVLSLEVLIDKRSGFNFD